ncbi:MAG: antitoxin MazE family protein [Devosia nanyangense]|uniref:Antitoxin MazE family protein n=1 Tax=Devosia nanyangense TaxID=1228055 RepID=A0A933NZ22_9HYPH|nr:antitoxin MazE family protein [Devosia nanyangense]
MGTPVNQRVQKRREALRAAGLRPVQLWLPDTRDPTFRAELAREARLIAQSDAKDIDLQERMDAVWEETLADVEAMEARDQASRNEKK